MKVMFLLLNQKKKHEGVVRPFLNFAKGMDSSFDISFGLLNCSEELTSYLSEGYRVSSSRRVDDLVSAISKMKPNLILADDDPDRLQLLGKIKKQTRIETACYVQILYGVHSLVNFDLSFLPLRQKIVYSSVKLLPFSVFSREYVSLLGNCDFVIANSKVTATLLRLLYDVDAAGVVYPPTDVDVFKPKAAIDGKEILVYLGSHLGDTEAEFTEKAVKAAVNLGGKVNVFGSSDLASALKSRRCEVALWKNMTDEELAELYARSSLTLCPQKWETFGLVPVESMACGTPVVALNSMGNQETILDEETGFLAENKEDFYAIIQSFLNGSNRRFLQREKLHEHVFQKFSIPACTQQLMKVLERQLGCEGN